MTELAIGLIDIQTLTKRMQRLAWVEVVCGLDHDSAFYNGSYHCRYARGHVTDRESGLVIYSHNCHWCNCYWLMKASTPIADQVCSNCRGPAIPSGQGSCWPDLLMVNDFVEVPEWRNGR